MRVVISGAGLGGLVLAHGLQGVADVIVLDKDPAAAATGGYRIALTPEAVKVIDRHLPAPLMAQLRDVSDGPRSFAQFTIADARLRPIVVAPEPDGEDRLLCQRRALRILLTRGLEDVRFSSTVVAAESSADGAAVTLADGTRLDADLVVAADGDRSATLRAIAGETSADTGLIGIAGSTPLHPSRPYPRYLRRGPALAVDRRGTGMFLSLASRDTGPVLPELAEAVGPPSLVWGLIARSDVVGELRDTPPDRLAAISADLVDGWNPWMAETILAAQPERTAAFSFRAADARAPRFGWAPSRITALGDAVHAMPPTGGRAGSTAIRSAGALADAIRDESDIDTAIRRYQARVDEWARPAIEESLGPVRVIRALRSPAAQLLAGPILAGSGLIGSWIHRRR